MVIAYRVVTISDFSVFCNIWSFSAIWVMGSMGKLYIEGGGGVECGCKVCRASGRSV